MRLLIVGTLNGQLGTASQMAIDGGAKVVHAPDTVSALQVLRSKGADLLMIDVALDIKSFLGQLRSEHFSIPVVACGVGTDARAAVAAIRDGAKEYIPLPPEAELIAAVLAAVANDDKRLIFKDDAMGQLVKLADQVAPSEASILITGESGTGKEVLAHYVHAKSNRSDKQFVSVNCAAIPENLLESELFGHEKGAFTGAVARRIGKFEEANGGTLLLDEISEMDLRLQAKLLRAIQEREIDRVGGSQPVKVDIRIIATSNRDLQEAVKDGKFREDLWFRLNVVNLAIPPLRERPDDVRILAEHFARKFADLNSIDYRPLSDDAVGMLSGHRWQGNVRELENTLHRAVLLAQGDTITSDDIRLPDGSVPGTGRALEADGEAADDSGLVEPLVGRTVAEVERDLIIDTLRHCLGNRTHAANVLGISIRTLRNKLNQYQSEGLAVPAPGERTSALL